MYRNTKLANSVRWAMFAGAAAAAVTAVPSYAADGEEAVERIEVTGSRIKRTDIESASPVSVFTAEDISNSGYSTIEDFVQNIPAISGVQFGASINNGSSGYATASLRGLGDSRTLILVNGRRVVNNDLNLIPVSFLERVEVLRDGASTIYGSDAIAGVINFITKKDFDGVEFTAQTDRTSKGDGEIQRYALTMGANSEKGNAVINMEYTKRDTIWQRDRGFADCPLAEDDGVKYCTGSGTTTPANVNLDGTGTFPKGAYVVIDGVPRPFDGATDAYNYAAVSYLVTPQEVFSFNATGNYEISDGGFSSVNAFTEVAYSNRQSEQLLAAEGTFWGQVVPEDHPDNPFGQDVVISRRLAETGGRRYTQDADAYKMLMGFEGYFQNGWSWDVSYNYQRFVDASVEYGLGNPERFNTLVNKDLCDADDACPGLWNPFAKDTLTPEMIAYATIPNSPVTRQEMRTFQANLSGDFGDFELPGGAIGWAVGYENRYESYEEQLDGAAVIGQIYNQPSDSTYGDFRVDEAFAEFELPILSGMPFAEKLTFSAAIRWTDYNYLDSSDTTTKFGIEYAPIDGLLLRATKAEGFRAPSITELFSAEIQNNPSYNDPCTNWGSSTNAIIRANCAADGVDPDYVATSNQATSVSGGNADLKPEESDSFTAGIVYTPTFFEGFNMAIDYFDIEIDDAIGSPGPGNIINACYNSQDFSSPLCDLIQGPSYFGQAPLPGSKYRSVLGPVAGILDKSANLSTFTTKGYDFDFSYTTPVIGGDLNLSLEGTYLKEYNYLAFEGEEMIKAAGKVAEDQNASGRKGAFAKWRANVNIGYSTDNFSVFWTSRYMSATDSYVYDADALDNTADAIWYHDVQGTYYLGENYSVTLGVRNLFDEEPPYVSDYEDMNTINTSYDTAGRYMYARFTARF
ncbi:TonB-dependent receptor [Gallaecimonas xiamenensis 3-C-1]|uniref:TonB-dependent receptor n=2 Tax=Gallaecimonas TaxID=745410 RepID=K2JU93_9GAMM|nr:TonB-dependent receptor [Gallaecimonas xiamenensis 3-C-1]